MPDLTQWADEEAAVKKIRDIYEKFRAASISLESGKKEYKERRQQDGKEYKSFEDAQWAQYRLFITTKTDPFAEKARKIAERMQGVLRASKVKSSEDLTLAARKEYYALNIEHAGVELQGQRPKWRPENTAYAI